MGNNLLSCVNEVAKSLYNKSLKINAVFAMDPLQ